MIRSPAPIDEGRVRRYVERAIAWSLAHVGSTEYSLQCLGFVEEAFERANDIEIFGGAFAMDSAKLYEASRSHGDAPAGAFVFFACSGPVNDEIRDWGHVGLALGDGRMVHAWGTVRVDPIAEIPALPGAEGWTAPSYIGWAGPRRILEGALERVWVS